VTARIGDWMQTASGRKVYPLDLRPEEVCIEDIAHHLSHLCRFAGATREFYSVAQHSVYVSRIVPPADALWGLLHDASEAYLIDLPRIIKRWEPIGGPYREAERWAMLAICRRFDLSLPEPESVKIADHRVLMAEKRDLMAQTEHRWAEDTELEPMVERIAAWHPETAREAFLTRFHRLTGGSHVPA